MNKLFIVFLVVGLVTVHAYVKREAETPQTAPLADFQKQITDITKNAQEQLSKLFDPEQFKKGLSDVVDKINEAVNQLKPKKEEAKQ